MTETEKLARTANRLINILGVLGVIAVVVFWSEGLFGPRDILYSTDSTDSEVARSGLTQHIDDLTGCHYLSKNEVLIPRMRRVHKTFDKTTQICTKKAMQVEAGLLPKYLLDEMEAILRSDEGAKK